MAAPIERSDCAELDRRDPLAPLRAEFTLPEGTIYLDGNSLGPLPRAARDRVREVVDVEWGDGLIRSWNDAGWFDKPRTLGARLAPLIGAEPDEVVVCDSTSINLFKVLSAALRLRPERTTVVSEASGFPTDLYIIEGAADRYRRRLLDDGEEVGDALDDDVAVVVLCHVDYRTGRLRDMARVTEQVHRAGALMIWDVCHSVGALPVRLGDCDADFAVGCTYKYVNGGPGSPAFLFAPRRHQDSARQPLSGWHGHADPFAFDVDYRPAPGISRFLVGSPPILAYAPLESSLDIWDRVDLDRLRVKSVALTSLFLDLVERECAGHGIEVASPRDPEQRGSQIALRHQEGYRIVRALIERGVIGDFREPDVMRFGFAPLYLRYVDVWDAVHELRDVLASGVWRADRFGVRSAVT